MTDSPTVDLQDLAARVATDGGIGQAVAHGLLLAVLDEAARTGLPTLTRAGGRQVLDARLARAAATSVLLGLATAKAALLDAAHQQHQHAQNAT